VKYTGGGHFFDKKSNYLNKLSEIIYISELPFIWYLASHLYFYVLFLNK
jgi:hypothetical protein